MNDIVALAANTQTQLPRLATTDQALQALIDATPGISLLIDLEGQILCANVASHAHFGLGLTQLIGLNVYSLFDEATAAGRRAMMSEAVQQRAPLVREDERGGLYFRHRLVPVIDADGVIHRVAVFAENITVQKKAELALRDSEEKYRFLAENTADTVWKLDRQMRFTFANRAYCLACGFSMEEIMGQSVMAFFTPEGRAIVLDMMEKRKEKESAGQVSQSLRFKVPHLRKGAEPFWAEINSMPLYDEAGEIIGFNGIMRDIDESQRYEKRLEDNNRQLQAQLHEISQLQARLKAQAFRDPLTEVYNRRYLEETLPRELSRSQRNGHPLALIMVDLDHFKRVNDTYGHPAGDAVLKALASILTHGAREGDIICRYGGEEFLVALPNMTLEQACQRAEAWRHALCESPIAYGDLRITCTLSAGVAAYPCHDGNMETLLHLADKALYRAKSNGRNCVESIAPSTPPAAPQN
jgi:diguanylate cyclase (GGDEF)-like protein/PAS domain S-box-containing protein